MAVTATLSNHFKAEKAKGNIDFNNDTFKGALMASSFSFDKDTHATWPVASGEEISATGNYSQQTVTVSGEVQEDDTNDRARVDFEDVTFTASGDAFDTCGSFVLYDDTSADDTIVGCIDFGTTYDVANGNSLEVRDIALNSE